MESRLPRLDESQLMVGPVHARRRPDVVKLVMKTSRAMLGPNIGDHTLGDELPHALAALAVTQLTRCVEGRAFKLALIEWCTSLAQKEILVLVITTYCTVPTRYRSRTSRISS